MIIDVGSPSEIECLVAILTLGLCTALENQSLTIEEASSYLFVPYTMSLLKLVKASSDLVHLIHLGTELEDFEAFSPSRLQDRLNTMKALALSILRSLPELSEHEYKEHWLQYLPDAPNECVLEERHDLLKDFPTDDTVTKDEKLYRMLLEAYDDFGSPFWHFVQELFSINYWDNPVPDDDADAVYRATIPEAQELMRELMRRGLVYIARIYGWPPPSSRHFAAADGEVEYIISDTQNWIGPMYEGPSSVHYSFCSTVPGASIPRESIFLLYILPNPT